MTGAQAFPPPMKAEDLVQRLLAAPDLCTEQQALALHGAMLDDELAALLKAQADQLLRIDAARSLQVGELMARVAAHSHRPTQRALSLLAQANALNIGLARYAESLDLYDEAAAIYWTLDRPVDAANAQIGRLYALANLGRYDEAERAGRQAAEVLRRNGQWLPLAKMLANLAITYGRRGDDAEACTLFDEALALYRQLGLHDSSYVARLQFSRAIVLRNLGRFADSIQASQEASALAGQSDQRVDQARSRQSLAITYFVLGRYNEALELLYQVREAFVADQRQRDVLLVDLFISDCLLHLRRFHDVLDTSRAVQERFSQLGSQLEVAQALLNQAEAYAGLQQNEPMLESLAAARTIFEAEGHRAGVLSVDVQRAALLLRQGQAEAAYTLALDCAGAFDQASLPVKQAQAQLAAARAALAMEQPAAAEGLVRAAANTAILHDIPELGYQAHHLAGRLALAQGQTEPAFAAYHAAIEDLERLCGRLMIEHRADFLEDKDTVYGDMVFLCLQQGQPARGLDYAERAKSRALLDLLAYRVDLSIRARSPQDAALVDELTRLRAEHDRLCRRRESREEVGQRGGNGQATPDQLHTLEKRITALWHELLVRNADYARDAALWQVRSEPIQPLLEPDTVLVEYFIARQQLIAFTITSQRVEAVVLPPSLASVQQQASKLWLNLRATPRSRPGQVASLTQNVQRLLHQLYQDLWAPIAERVDGYAKVIVVPHGSLHYLPFHALHDGAGYLVERHEFSYLPGASFLRYCSAPAEPAGPPAAFGYSLHGRLPFAAHEAQQVAQLTGGAAWVEDQATLDTLRQAASEATVLHMATHGEFRPDNPLFSGLALADGTLTTLDVFNLRLRCSLATLSACQTGQSVVSGGDELLGLMRAFLYAGASSLALALWPIEDVATERLMTGFYGKLSAGWSKGAALRAAQLAVLQQAGNGEAAPTWQHPYYWAAFILVGHRGSLSV